MPAGVAAAAAAQPDAGPGTVPFELGTHPYAERLATDTWQTTANSQEFVHNITPGGFLRGVRLMLTSSGGVAGTLTADAPWNVLQSISVENIDGSPILYPMNGYSYYLALKYFLPWKGDYAKYYDFSSNQATPGFSLPIWTEIRDTAGVLANTDARAQYRVRFTFAPTTVLGSGYTTAPTFSANLFMEAYSQPDKEDLHGNPIQGLPDGLSIAHIIRQQTLVLNAASANNILQLANTGNEVRGLIMVVRDNANARQDYLSDPIRVRLDDRSLGVFSPDEIFHRMSEFYEFLRTGTSTRETGVYVIPRYRDPGAQVGDYWLATSNATYLVIESATKTGAVNVPGTVQVITDEVVPVGPVPANLEGI